MLRKAFYIYKVIYNLHLITENVEQPTWKLLLEIYE